MALLNNNDKTATQFVDYRQQNIEECGYPYKISVVMAVYNVEEYLNEAVDSIIAQTIGFEENVQIILVDDGSPDNCGKICDEYKKQYPNNIIVVHKKNGGVSSARNTGVKLAEGRYVNYLDSDDMLTEDTLENVYEFFDENNEHIDLVSIPLRMFEAQHGGHILNYKYKNENYIVNLKYQYRHIQMHIASSFIKLEVAKLFLFDEKLRIAEDGKVAVEILLEKQQYGLVSSGTYMYRKRLSELNPSAMQKVLTLKEHYVSNLERFNLSILETANNKYGYVPYFVQYTCIYDLQWRMKQSKLPEGIITEKDLQARDQLIQNILQYIDDKIIVEQKHIFVEHKYLLLKYKYGHDANIENYFRGMVVSFGNTNLIDQEKILTRINFIEINNNIFTIEGYTMFLGSPDEEVDVYIKVNDEYILAKTVERDVNQYYLNNVFFRGIAFRGEFRLEPDVEKYEVNIACKIRNNIIIKNDIRFNHLSVINMKGQYYYKDNYLLSFSNYTFTIEKYTKSKYRRADNLYCKFLFKQGKPGKKAAISRYIARLLSPKIKKSIWIISDRINKADDNGEAFYKYAQQIDNKNTKLYFAIHKKCPDRNRLKKEGFNLIPFLGWRHKFLLLLSPTIISSHADIFISHPFGSYNKYYSDLLNKSKYVFLQHGITLHDVSDWLNRYSKNFDIFSTVTVPEYNSILTNNYHYSTQQVKLVGFPRYDLLYNDSKKYITFMPTWRRSLVTAVDPKTGNWEFDIDNFKKSDYFKFYNGILNNKKLLSAAQEYGYTICYRPHPNTNGSMELYDKSESVKFIDFNEPYRKIFAESDLILTDYSSIAFDFAYLRKPIIYCQFDSDSFFGDGHLWDKGYFEYERDGFGEVEYTLEDTVNRIIEYMVNNCELKEGYRQRIDNTFAFDDKNNCKRVYDAILNLDN